MRKMFQLMLMLVMAAVVILAVIPAFAEGDLTVRVDTEITTVGTPPEPAETYTVRMVADGEYPMPGNAVGGSYDLEMEGPGSGAFPEITYDEMGIYTYTISQVAGENGEATYDGTEYNLKVTVYRDEETDERLVAVVLRNSEEEEKTTACSFLNEYPAATTTVTISKVWDDEDDYDGVRPASLEVTLSADGEAIETVTLNAANHWTASVEDLPMFLENSRTAIEYAWSEPEVEGYTLASSETEEYVTTMTNRHEISLLDLTIRKAWYDNGNAAGERPTRLTVYLYANGQPLQRIVLTANTGWTATVTGLPRYDDDGNAINYVWRETAINGYVLTGTARLGNLTVLTNTRLEEYETPLGLGNVFVNAGDCFE